MEEALLFAVKIDQSEAIKQTTDLSREIGDLVARQKELDLAGEKNTETYAENAAMIRALKKEQSDVNRAIDASVKAFNSANGSINQQRANLSILTQQYNALSKEERENEKVGGSLQKQMKALSDELKNNESAVGDNRRNVGNYKDAILDASRGLTIFGTDLVALKEGFEKVNNGIDLAKGGFSGFNGILKASALPVIIILLGGLIAAFTKFEPLMDKVKAQFAGLNAVVDVFVERLTRVGRGLVEIFNGNFSEGVDQIRNSFDGMAQSMGDARVQAIALSEAMDELDDRNRAQIILNAEAKKSVDQLLLQARNRTLSERERLKLLDQAGKIERANFEQNKAIAEEEYRIALESAALDANLSKAEIEELLTNTERREELEKRIGILDGKRLDALAQKKAAIIATENETINVEEKIANRRAALIEQQNAEREKQIAAQKKAAEDLQKEFDKLLSDFDATSKEQTAQYFNELAQRRAEDLAAQSKYFADKQTALVNSYINETITTKEYEDALLQLQIENLEKQKEVQLQNFEDTSAIELQLAQARLNIKKKSEADITASNKAEADSYIQLAQTAQNGISALAATFAEGSDLQRAAALTNAGVNLGTALGNIVATSSAPSPDNLATGGIAGVIKYGALLAQVLSAFAQVKSIIGGAAAGGGSFYTKGPTMLLVGDNPGGVERIDVSPISGRGKTVVNKNSNLVAMAGGGSLIADGGASISNISKAVQNSFDMETMLRRLPAPIVQVSEINRVNNNVSKKVQVSELK
jgi:hypothetical protein